ncbi:MAG: hypothetical protein UT34_C0001G0327 [candidate division WS6 bacterium GW2011_GWF2_39_15]|uniref:Uncharacterized protein n=1 Tax=candidate division WS6 bacterium GW2011_GWF2_39_15 TaxID=1619100 RepID=A0A0G0QXD8_9BACT|nr:MAG: hypothetical protein UT34_C0001G0327 [candidate division WS6 bacterium GW2011_GWF2_39_15]
MKKMIEKVKAALALKSEKRKARFYLIMLEILFLTIITQVHGNPMSQFLAGSAGVIGFFGYQALIRGFRSEWAVFAGLLMGVSISPLSMIIAYSLLHLEVTQSFTLSMVAWWFIPFISTLLNES